MSNSVKCILCRKTYNITMYYVLCIIVCTKWIIGSVPLQKLNGSHSQSIIEGIKKVAPAPLTSLHQSKV